MPYKKWILAIIICGLFSFKLTDKKIFEFKYPKSDGTNITLSADHFTKFAEEWRGSDYYYFAEGDGFVCSVLYYKLNDQEKISLVEAVKTTVGGGPDTSPAYPYAYFKSYTNLKPLESNDVSWGKATDDFMFRQNDIVVTGTKFSQKHMYGYCMFDKDLFVNIHLSKAICSSSDSTEMLSMLKSLSKRK